MKPKMNLFQSITPVLSIPEKLNTVILRVKKLRIPHERNFSARDVLISFAVLLILLLQALIPALRSAGIAISILALVLAVIPVLLQGMHLVVRRIFPLEEVVVLLSAILAFLLKEYAAGILFTALSVLVWQLESYCLLQEEAASATFSDENHLFRDAVTRSDPEKSAERRLAALCATIMCGLLVLIGLVMAVLGLFHLQSAGIWFRRCLVAFLVAKSSVITFNARMTHFGAVFSAAKAGGIFRSEQIPEELARCKTFTFAKTGTVTDGRFQIIEIAPKGITEEELLRIAAVAECMSDHPIAAALKSAAGLKGGVVPSGVLNSEEMPGKGVSTFFSGHQLYAGNALLLEEHDIWYQIPDKPGTAVHIAVDNTYRGYILVSDSIRESAFEALEELRSLGVSRLVMLSGDVPSVSRTMAASLNFDMVKSQLSPDEKASAIRYLRSIQGDGASIAAVGDGKHDQKLFEEADISICMEPDQKNTADLSIYSDRILAIPQIYRICRESERAFRITVFTIIGSKLLLAILGLAGLLTPLFVIVADFLISLAALVYSLTCLSLDAWRKQK